jgi:Leucine-rich repeat (LRR) protein
LNFLSCQYHAQTYADDLEAVRALLEANGIYNVDPAEVSASDASIGFDLGLSRIVWVTLAARDLNTVVIPDEFYKVNQLEEINLGMNNLTGVPSGLKRFPMLKTIILTGNCICPGAGPVWYDSMGLSWREMQYCGAMPEYQQDSMAVRAILDSNGMQNTKVRLVTYARNGRIRRLDWSQMGLKVIPGEIGRLTALEQINLSLNKIVLVSPEIGNLLNLREVNISENQLTSFPNEVDKLDKLSNLNLQGNKLTGIPDSIIGCDSLNILLLAGNNILLLPDSVSKLKLHFLSLGANALQIFPSQLCNMTSLEYLSVSGCGLTSIPQEISKLSNLKSLWLSGNNLSTLPDSIINCNKISELDVKYNHICTVSPSVDQWLTALQPDWKAGQSCP